MRDPVDLGAVDDQIERLRLVPAGPGWQLQVDLKERGPRQSWQAWHLSSDY